MGEASSRVVLALALLISAASPARASGEPQLDTCLAALSDAEVARLTDRVVPAIEAQQKRARWWLWGWLAANSGFVIGATAFAVFEEDPAFRDANRWGAAGAAFSALSLFIPPLHGAFVDRHLGQREGASDRAYLARALRLVKNGASQEHGARAWWTHTANASFALAQGLFVGIRHDSPWTATWNSALSFAIGTAQALTSPRGLTRLARELDAESAACAALASRPPPGPSLDLRPSLGGVSLSVSF